MTSCWRAVGGMPVSNLALTTARGTPGPLRQELALRSRGGAGPYRTLLSSRCTLGEANRPAGRLLGRRGLPPRRCWPRQAWLTATGPSAACRRAGPGRSGSAAPPGRSGRPTPRGVRRSRPSLQEHREHQEGDQPGGQQRAAAGGQVPAAAPHRHQPSPGPGTDQHHGLKPVGRVLPPLCPRQGWPFGYLRLSASLSRTCSMPALERSTSCFDR
jgi:hypothetical protein